MPHRIHRHALRHCVVGFAIVTLSACSSSADSPNGPALEDVGPLYAEALCTPLNQCLGPFADLFLGGEDCATNFGLSFEDSVLPEAQASIEAGRTIYHSEKVNGCLEALETRGCDSLGDMAPQACEDVFEGTVAAGGDCATDIECAGDAFCGFEGAACPGTCTTRSLEDGDCNDDDDCSGALVCHNNSCTVAPGDGDACEGTDGMDCRAGYVCIGSNDTASGTCKAVASLASRAEGESCDFDTPTLCMAGLSCVADSVDNGQPQFVCRAIASAGQACKVGLPSPCEAGYYCDADTDNMEFTGNCVASPTAGEPCQDIGFDQTACAAGLVCLNGECTARKRLDATCSSDAECYSGACVVGKCKTDICTFE